MQYITGTYFNSSFLTGKKSPFYIYKCTLIRSFQTTTLAQVDYIRNEIKFKLCQERETN